MDPVDVIYYGYLTFAILFIILTMWAVSKMNYKWQNRMFSFAAIMCVLSCFYRFAMHNSWTKGVDIPNFCESWLQVCNFNCILLPLMLIPKCEIARQYSLNFSMLSAIFGIVGVTFPGHQWYDGEVMSYWMYHLFAIACPLWMVAARRLKPQKKYVLKCGLCVFLYFSIVALVCTICIQTGAFPEDIGYSFIYNTHGIVVFDWLYSLIPVPYFYLYPLIPLVTFCFYLFALAFKKYQVVPYTEEFVKDEEFKSKHPGFKRFKKNYKKNVENKPEEQNNAQTEKVITFRKLKEIKKEILMIIDNHIKESRFRLSFF